MACLDLKRALNFGFSNLYLPLLLLLLLLLLLCLFVIKYLTILCMIVLWELRDKVLICSPSWPSLTFRMVDYGEGYTTMPSWHGVRKAHWCTWVAGIESNWELVRCSALAAELLHSVGALTLHDGRGELSPDFHSSAVAICPHTPQKPKCINKKLLLF